MRAPPSADDALSYPIRGEGELDSGDGAVGGHWRYLLDSLRALGPAELAERQRRAGHLLRDDGASYNVYPESGVATPLQGSRVWQLDLVPQLIRSDEWRAIEAGLLERAELLNLVLRDLYGPRELIRHRVIPPELLLSHAGFLRRCQGVFNPGEHQQLVLYAVDMMRTDDGRTAVIGDRTQAPSGMGYALENRTVMSRIFPSLFRESNVHRLSRFFGALHQSLSELAPTVEDPRVVVLTPGQHNETHFEHAYLANYLGYPLVQGGDLTVRGGTVWMKSLGGLLRVDVILRRVDDAFCDPVELRGDSRIGVPGLLEAARSGKVVLANPLGSGVLENQALLRYLPAIGRHFLGREPRLATARTYWCGEPEDLSYVLEHLGELVIKPCRMGVAGHSVSGAQLDAAARRAWAARLRSHPHYYVAQETLRSALLPAWQQGCLQPRPAVLRSFAVASGISYVVLPGGLTRVADSAQTVLVSNQRGAGSKDTWVLASEPVKPGPLRPVAVAVAPLREHGVDLPSRVAENLFWLGRYAERSESAMRLLRTIFTRSNGSDEVPAEVQGLLLRSLTHLTVTFPGFEAGLPEEAEKLEQGLLAVILDAATPGTVCASLDSMLNAAEEVKETLSADTQRIIGNIRDEQAELRTFLQAGLGYAPEETLSPLVTSLLALAGLSQESMIRGSGWHFLQMGRRLERGQQVCRLLQTLLRPALDDYRQYLVLESALLSLEGLITFRRRYGGGSSVYTGLELMLLDPDNPRSLLFQLQQLEQHLAALPRVVQRIGLERDQRPLFEAVTALQLADMRALADPGGGEPAPRDQLADLLGHIRTLLDVAAEAMAERFFDHTEGPQQLVPTGWEEAP